MNAKRKVKKLLWKIYVEETKSLDKILLEGKPGEEKLIKRIDESYKYLNSVASALKNIYNPRFKTFNSRLSRIPILGKIYRYYYKINGHTFKYYGPITIVGFPDKNGNYIYPNTRWNRIIKLNKWIR